MPYLFINFRNNLVKDFGDSVSMRFDGTFEGDTEFL